MGKSNTAPALKAPKPITFKKGDRVTWYSSFKNKIGVVVAVIATDEDPGKKIKEFVRAGTHSSKFGYGGARAHQSYLVEVPGAGPKNKAALYWPTVSALSAYTPD